MTWIYLDWFQIEFKIEKLPTEFDFIFSMQQWEMRRQIVTGKQSYHQIMTELELRILFVQSMCVRASPRNLYLSWYHFSALLFCVMLLFNALVSMIYAHYDVLF